MKKNQYDQLIGWATGSTGTADNDMLYRSEITGPQGAQFELLKEPQHRSEDVKRAKFYLRANYDVVSIRIIAESEIIGGKPSSPDQPKQILARSFGTMTMEELEQELSRLNVQLQEWEDKTTGLERQIWEAGNIIDLIREERDQILSALKERRANPDASKEQGSRRRN